jgi:hypothetical protein
VIPVLTPNRKHAPSIFPMKAILSALFLLSAALCQLQAQAPVAPGTPPTVFAWAVFKPDPAIPNSGPRKVDAWVVASTKSAFAYYEQTPQAGAQPVRANMADLQTLFIFEPQDYLEAVDLYEGRKYEQAKAALEKVSKKYAAITGVPNSPGVMAAYYHMECLRKLSDLEGLRQALQTFKREDLTHKTHLQQLEIYLIWDAVRAKTWDKVAELAAARETEKLPADQRAQVAYCYGLALDAQGKTTESLLALQTAMTADAGDSEVVTRDAALKLMSVIVADAEVKEAIEAFQASGGKTLTKGYTKLLQGAAVAAMFEKHLGSGMPLPSSYKGLLTYYKPPKIEEAAEEE